MLLKTICAFPNQLITLTKMIESGLWMEVSDTQESGHVFNSTCWNCGGTGHCAKKFPFENAPGLNPNKVRGRWFAPRDGKQISSWLTISF